MPDFSNITTNQISATMATLAFTLSVINFYHQYLRKFRPKLFVSPSVRTILRQNDLQSSIVDIESILVDISISNPKNSYGVIEDIVLRVLPTNAINPEAHIYLASDSSNLDTEQFIRFVPIVMVPKSFSSKTIKFSTFATGRGNLKLNKTSFYTFEIFIRLEGAQRWNLAKKLFVFNRNFHNQSSTEIEYISSESRTEKDSLLKKLPSIKPEGFITISGEEIFYLRNQTLFFLKKPFTILSSFARFMSNIVSHIIVSIYQTVIINPLIFLGLSRFEMPPNPQMINEDAFATKSYAKIKSKLICAVRKINLCLTEENIVTVTENNESLVLKRNGHEISFQKSHIINLRVSGKTTDGFDMSQLFVYQHTKIGYKFWTYNGKYISLRSISIKILDSFLLFTKS
ncbi:hypothetical protein [Leptospira stimsonii]|uniref:Uncharacterized protein n=1 Tax=Leptospira stimsonii TaxID=2202203 RepID=A0ABY2N4Y6_9LEPT|nr:hypothetical protein [Leptospira stimsonii]TGK24953.1 hypothetical protein EHO98_03125 [Leptospira stimsonii]TGM17173.1 hypothetical protein EHQ90_08135 [Leptospira stimsonii]